MAGYGFGPGGTSTDFLTMTNVKTEGTIRIEKDQSKRNYLQLEKGSPGTELGAGLFKVL